MIASSNRDLEQGKRKGRGREREMKAKGREEENERIVFIESKGKKMEQRKAKQRMARRDWLNGQDGPVPYFAVYKSTWHIS